MSAHAIQVTPSAYSYPLLIGQLLHSALANAAEQEIVYVDGRRHSYAQFARRVHQLAHALTRLGVQPGDTVAVMDWDSHRYLECFFAVPMLGAVLQTVNVRLSDEQIQYTLNHAGARVLLVNSDFVEPVARFALDTVQTRVLLADEAMALPAGYAGEYEALLADCPEQFEFTEFDENTRATTFYTTGTTGLPKGVYFSHRQLVLHTLAVCNALALAPQQGSFHRGDVYMPLTPMFHVHAWGMPYIATMAGVKQVYPGRYIPERILKLVQRERVSFSHCVPTILSMVLNHPSAGETDLRGWKLIIGGSALTTALVKQALERGIDLFTGYGMSETCPILTLAQIDPVDSELDGEAQIALRVKTGRSVPLVALRTVDPEMQTLPRDGHSAGEIVVRAPWLTQGYLHNADASEELWHGGWLHTQDIGHVDPRGYLQVTDRLKDVIKTGGEWVSSLELEELIGRHPDVAEVAVIGVPDAKWGERPLAFVVARSGIEPDADSIRSFLRGFADAGRISRYGVPDEVRFVGELPRTSVGKLNKRALREHNR